VFAPWWGRTRNTGEESAHLKVPGPQLGLELVRVADGLELEGWEEGGEESRSISATWLGCVGMDGRGRLEVDGERGIAAAWHGQESAAQHVKVLGVAESRGLRKIW